MKISRFSRFMELDERILAGSIPEPNSGCWIWLKGLEGSGYPALKFGVCNLHGNRASWMAFYGYIPKGLCVLHKCDNRTCVNPDHLFLGTKSENTIDMIKKGRANRPSGERHHASKLTSQDVIAIRASSLGCGKLSRQYGVGKSAIRDIINGKTWKEKTP